MEVRPLSENLRTIVVNELNEDPSKVDEDINHIKEWIKKQPHLVARQDNQFILNFLRGCKFSIQKAKEKIDSFYTVKAMLNEQFTNRDPYSAEIQLILNAGGILPLPNPGFNESRVILYRWAAYNPTTMPFSTIIKVGYMILDILAQEDDNVIISGVHILTDYDNFQPAYLKQLTPSAFHKSLVGVESSYALRLKGLDIINVPGFFGSIYSILKLVLTQKMKDRTKVYGSDYAPDLYDRIPLNALPKEYGGTGASVKELTVEWKKKVQSYQRWFADDEKYYCKDELRPEGSKTDIFGADGSFRKLNID